MEPCNSGVSVWTDGSCLNNGKLNATSGIGVFYRIGDSRNTSSSLPSGRSTNNRAELCAILYALCTNLGSENVTIHTDSQYSINCVTTYRKKWENNSWKTADGKPVEWSGIIRYIHTLIDSRGEKGGNTSFVHVKAHDTDANNNMADALARRGAARGTMDSKVIFLSRVCKVPFV